MSVHAIAKSRRVRKWLRRGLKAAAWIVGGYVVLVLWAIAAMALGGRP
jgi:hypothetical protein